MRPAICLVLCTLLVIAAHTSAFAQTSGSLICSDGIISVGDVASELVRKCGEPAFTTQREQRIVEVGDNGENIITTFVIDDWTFNFGKDRFQYRILLKNGKVFRIDSLEYGY
jgi:hypothetical protein